ncbi:DUF5666 domain-containing protein [Actinoplanes regularis]|uniref:DUF5666 domain-containing protein n=1 Tax=Actinoplanes regularis TaxID=52697 RepID=UPI0024A5C3A3|nr:DUF5666 domain-containing protein [Actinoplanes regularis]GLW31901.1 hypothetical protein Areg01_48400 [Actinoplanes regularis]
MIDDTETLPRTPSEAEHENLNEAIAAAAPRRWWNRTTLVLAGFVLLAGGFLGGVQAHQRWGSSSAAPATSAPGNGFPAGPGTPSFGPAPGGVTSGTLSRVDGTTLYVRTEKGETVTVRATDTTPVSRTALATVADLTDGLRVTVQGTVDAEGVVTATSISAG